MLRCILIALLAAAGLASCGGPCTDCADVAGIYDETMDVTNVKDSSCNTIYSRGDTVRLKVTQAGSAVRVSWAGSDGELTGVLNADDSLQIAEFPGVAADENGGGEIPLSMLLSGVFEGQPGAWTFEGVYQASAKTQDCIVRVKTHWHQRSR